MLGLLLLTLRELRARKVVVGLFVVATAVWIALALALQLDIVDGSLAGFRIFGNEALTPPTDSLQTVADTLAADSTAGAADAMSRDEQVEEDMDAPFRGTNPLESLVFTAQAFVAGAAYWVGILLCLFATGGLVATLVEPGQADLLLAKPLSRAQILAGRLGGVGVVTLSLIAYLISAVWLVMSVKSGIWNPRFLLAIPAIWAMFAVLYGAVTLASVWSGSGPLALVVTLGLVFVTLVLAIPGLAEATNATVRPLVIGTGWVLPRFAAVGANLVPHLASGTQPGDPSLVAEAVPLATSLLFGAACYGGAFFLFARRDY